MSKSAILKSSIAKKYWMALTGLFLCIFLIGHLIGNLQLIFIHGEEGRRAFNEYAYFMQHNIFIKVLSYLTYLSILFHAIDGLMLAVQNKKARPQKYAYNNPGANSSTASRQMALLGSIILIFIVTHMVNFWAKMHFEHIPLHTYEVTIPGESDSKTIYYTHDHGFPPLQVDEIVEVKHETNLYLKDTDVKLGEGYKDLHSVVMAFFGQSKNGFVTNSMALVATILYVLSMIVLSFHLWHGFASAFQSLGLRHKRYTPAIGVIGKLFAIVVPFLFAIIPVLIFIGYVK
ncbi:MAG: succinate dehydrogenase [Candidatus Fluviicola riflensis]|nr:MAG: succinate dehydrogenase [Candidatus Fluviicola riflensis]OGS78086.1 MAG: succinate dehydrogenase [Candidatus Fluviicola riflensis]OGS85152.1 MAG: succinate dehydrogenase [Fluviicola sp. RIFCSPHIGHO2_01_FULL_43_53]OGS89423.1 MAG: succinate dehydrogenase [Fluviicola sp. RIFCSPHIGHO2_12_FULL_43_24]